MFGLAIIGCELLLVIFLLPTIIALGRAPERIGTILLLNMLCAVVPIFWPFLLMDVIRAPGQGP